MVADAEARGHPAGALHCKGIGGQHAEAEAVAEAGADFPVLELKNPGAGACVEPGRGGAASEANQARGLSPPLHAVGIVGITERVGTSLGLVPCEDALGLCDVAQALGVDLHQVGLPEFSRLAVQGLPLGPEHLAARTVEGPERVWAAAHRDVRRPKYPLRAVVVPGCGRRWDRRPECTAPRAGTTLLRWRSGARRGLG
jgi:hypothetical protein